MARKKPVQYVPLEERPEFIAAVAALPADPAELERTAAGVRHLYHRAMLVGDVQALDDADVVYRACVVKLNGGTHFGSAHIQEVLQTKFAAVAGQVPEWGQAGEFLLDVEGMRIVVKICPDPLSNHCGAELHVVDFDKPFVSRTGYRHQYMRPTNHFGRTVDQAVRAEVLEFLAGEGGAELIGQQHVAPKNLKLYPWLADALAGVQPDGQLAMFGDAPKDLSTKPVMSNAERQRLFRQRQREQKAAEGIQSIRLTSTERCVLSLGLLAHEDLDHRPKDWATSKKPGFDALLKKLWPEGDNGRYLAEPNRSTYRPTAFLRGQLERAQDETRRLKEVLHQMTAEANISAAALASAQGEDFAALEVTDGPLQTVWERLPTDFARCATALGLLRLRNNQHAELANAVEVLQARLRAAGLSDQVTSNTKNTKPWRWNVSPLADYRATSAPEYMERQIRKLSPADECAELARRVEYLEQEQALLEAERNKAFAANRTLTERLRRAGLPTDYRPQAGEQ